MITIVLAVLVGGFWLGFWASYKNFVKPVEETEAHLRKELALLRIELWDKDTKIANLKWWLAMPQATDPRWIRPECKIPHRAPSDVLFIPHSEDLLR